MNGHIILIITVTKAVPPGVIVTTAIFLCTIDCQSRKGEPRLPFP